MEVRYLVAIVLFGVVGGRHHDPTTQTQVRHCERLQREEASSPEEAIINTRCVIIQPKPAVFNINTRSFSPGGAVVSESPPRSTPL